jgi:hypothetical protein
MRLKKSGGLAIVLVLTGAVHCVAAGPETDADWHNMYEACLRNAHDMQLLMDLKPEFAPAYCGCVGGELKKLPEASREPALKDINERCLTAAQGPKQ